MDVVCCCVVLMVLLSRVNINLMSLDTLLPGWWLPTGQLGTEYCASACIMLNCSCMHTHQAVLHPDQPAARQIMLQDLSSSLPT